MSSSSLYVAIVVSRFIAWFPILFFDTMPRQSATSASYPNVSIRALGTLEGSRAFGHGSVAPLAFQVFSRSPVRPWMKTILCLDKVSHF